MNLCYLSYPDGSDPTYLEVNPASYDDRPAERRASSHATLEGGRVWQDFGVAETDRQLRLRIDWMSVATLEEFQEKYFVSGQVWKWADNQEREYLVFFRLLVPERIRGHDAYRVEMVFEIIEVIT